MRRTMVFILMLLFLLSSCHKDEVSYKDLLAEGNYEAMKEMASKEFMAKPSQESLYYKAISEYYLEEFDTAVEDSILYLSMYNENKVNTQRIILLKGEDEDAYEAGKGLYQSGEAKNTDKIRYLSVLNHLGYSREALSIALELKGTLPAYEYALATISSASSTETVLDALMNLYRTNGVDKSFLSVAPQGMSLLLERNEREALESFVFNTYNGNTSYALIIGDLYYNLGNKAEAERYWIYTAKDFPEEYAERVKYLK